MAGKGAIDILWVGIIFETPFKTYHAVDIAVTKFLYCF